MNIFVPGKENSVITCGKECQYFIDHPTLPSTGTDLLIIAIIAAIMTIVILNRKTIKLNIEYYAAFIKHLSE